MTTQPLVTVIIPSYNHERYIAQAIESVSSQSYKEIELIVIDDGSKDQSLKIINTLAEKHGIIVIARENRGLAKTLNEGVGLANGKYISFLASDDYYLPSRIENAVLQFEKSANKVAAVYCDGYIINDEGDKKCSFGERYPRPLIGNVYNNLLVGNWIPALGMTYRTEVLKEFMFDERFQVEDHTLYLRMFKSKKNKLVFYNAFDFAYRLHNSNMSGSEELINNENTLMQDNFTDMGRFAKFKQQLKTRDDIGVEVVRYKNYYLLYLQKIRWLQNKSMSDHRSILGLFFFYILRLNRKICGE